MNSMIKNNWVRIVIVIIVIILIVLASNLLKKSDNTENTQIANPASVNCIKNGGQSSIIDKPEGQLGMCTFSDGKVCEEWAYFRGECGKNIRQD